MMLLAGPLGRLIFAGELRMLCHAYHVTVTNWVLCTCEVELFNLLWSRRQTPDYMHTALHHAMCKRRVCSNSRLVVLQLIMI